MGVEGRHGNDLCHRRRRTLDLAQLHPINRQRRSQGRPDGRDERLNVTWCERLRARIGRVERAGDAIGRDPIEEVRHLNSLRGLQAGGAGSPSLGTGGPSTARPIRVVYAETASCQ